MGRVKAIGGDLKSVQCPAPASVAISVGDFLLHDDTNDCIQPASAQVTTGLDSLAKAQEAFHDAFMGVSQDQRLAAQDKAGKVLVATAGRFLVPIADDATARDPGTLYGLNGAVSGGVYPIVNQELVVVATANLAVGRAVQQVAAHATEAVIEIESTRTMGGPKAMA